MLLGEEGLSLGAAGGGARAGQQEYPTGRSKPKGCNSANTGNGPSQTLRLRWSPFSGFLLPIPLFNLDTPSLQSPLSFCTRWSVRTCPASFLRLSSLPSSTPHPVEVGPSSQDPPHLAVPASPKPSPAGTWSFLSQQAEAPEALIMSHFKVFWKQVRDKV